MSQLFQFKSATATSIEYSGSDYLYIINNIAWTSIDIDTIEFGQLLDIVGKVNNGALYALRRTRLFDALDVKLGTDVSGNYAPTIQGIVNEWNGTEYEENSDAPIKRIKVFDSKETDIIQYDEIEKELTDKKVNIVWKFQNEELNVKFIFIRDPEDNLIQFLQRLK